MTNRLGRAVRDPQAFQFDGKAQVASSLPDVPAGDGGAASAFASLMGGLSQQLGQLADRAAKREGEAAGYAEGFASNPSRPDPEAAPARPGPVTYEGGGSQPAAEGGSSSKPVPSGGRARAEASAERARYARDRLVSKHGWQQHWADGVIGNIRAESGMRTTARNPGDGSDGSDSIGLGQWNGKRAVALKAFAAARGKPVDDLDTQVDFIAHEMGTTESAAFKMLKASRNVDEATAAGISFERPKGWTAKNPRGGLHWKNRLDYANALAGSRSSTALPSVGGIPVNEPPPGSGMPGAQPGDGALPTPSAPALADLPQPVRPDPPAPPAPLALRRDGTIYGEARDAAAVRVYAGKLDAGIIADTAAAYEDHKDDPAALKARLGEIRKAYEKDASFDQDPELRANFERRLEQRSGAYMADANARAERRIDAEAKAATTTALTARRQDLDRQAHLYGANPAGDQNLDAQVRSLDAAADHAASRGDITPSQRDAYKLEARQAIVVGKVRGAFDALPTPEAKEKFARGLDEAWSSGDGAIAGLDRQTVATLASQLTAAARSERAELRAAYTAENAQLRRRIADDVTSIAATGQNLKIDGLELSESDVATQLGPAAAEKWVADRQRARALFAATSDLKTLTADEIAARIESLEPAPGSENYADAEKVKEAAEKEAAKILKLRAADPAASVDHVAEVKAAKAARDPREPTTFEAAAEARLDAQEAIGIPEIARQPLTKAEAKALIDPVLRAEVGQEYKALNLVIADVELRYGRHGEAVVAQLLEQTGISQDEARAGQAMFKKIRAGQSPSRPETRAGDVAGEAGQADRAMSGASAPRPSQIMSRGGPAPKAVKDRMTPKPAAGTRDGFPMPNRQQTQLLLRRPDMKAQFEAKFGPGSADYYTRPSVTPAEED